MNTGTCPGASHMTPLAETILAHLQSERPDYLPAKAILMDLNCVRRLSGEREVQIMEVHAALIELEKAGRAARQLGSNALLHAWRWEPEAALVPDQMQLF